MIETDLRKYLASRPTIQAIVGAVTPKVYPVKAPQRVAPPYVTIRRMSGGHQHTLRGAAGFALPRIAVSSYATGKTGYEDSKNLANAVRHEMQGFSGPMETTEVQSVICTDEEDLYDDPIDSSDIGIFNTMLEFQIRYTETVTAFTET